MIKKFEAFKHIPQDVLNNIGKNGKPDLKLDFSPDDIDKLQRVGFELINPKLMSCTEGKFTFNVEKIIEIQHDPKKYKYIFKFKEENKVKERHEFLINTKHLIDHNKKSFENVLDKIYLFLKKNNVDLEKEEDIVNSYRNYKNSISKSDPYEEEDWG